MSRRVYACGQRFWVRSLSVAACVCTSIACTHTCAAELYERASEEAFEDGDGRAGVEYAAKCEELGSAT